MNQTDISVGSYLYL